MAGAVELIEQYKPILLIELVKSNKTNVQEFVTDHGFSTFHLGLNMLAVHNSDPSLNNLIVSDGVLSLRKHE